MRENCGGVFSRVRLSRVVRLIFEVGVIDLLDCFLISLYSR